MILIHIWRNAGSRMLQRYTMRERYSNSTASIMTVVFFGIGISVEIGEYTPTMDQMCRDWSVEK